MKAESGGSVEEPGKELGSVQQESRTCPVCGTKFFATADKAFCPVCILNRAFRRGICSDRRIGFGIWVSSSQRWRG